MASSASSSSSSLTVTLPITNITNFVPIELDGTNYLVWKYQMESILKSAGLMCYVDGTNSAPPATISVNGIATPNPALEGWTRIDQFVISCINATLAKTVAPQALGFTTARSLWLSLEQTHL